MTRERRKRWARVALSLLGASAAHGAALAGAALVGVHALAQREPEGTVFAVLVRRGPTGPGGEEPPPGSEVALTDQPAEPGVLPDVLDPALLPLVEPFVLPDIGPWPSPEPAAEPVGPEPGAEPAPAPPPAEPPADDALLAAAAAAAEAGSASSGAAPAGGGAGGAPADELRGEPGGGSPAAAPGGPPPGTPDGTGSGPARVAELRPAAMLDCPDPDYPDLSRQLGEQGSVLCLLHLDASGRVEQVEVVESSGYARLDDAARARLSLWRFRPATLGGDRVASTYRHRVRFKLVP